MAHIPGLYLKPESFSPSYGRKKMTDTPDFADYGAVWYDGVETGAGKALSVRQP